MISNIPLQQPNKWRFSGVGRVRISIFIALSLLCVPMAAHANKSHPSSAQTSLSERIEMAKEAGVQQDVLLLVTQDVLEKKLDGNSAACLLNVVLTAKEAELPASVLEEKIREGSAKGVQGKRICMALKSMVEEMKFSKQLLTQHTNEPPKEAAIRAIHEALSQGVTHAQAEAFLSTHSNKNRKTVLEAFSLYALLKQSGVSSSQLNEFIDLVMKDDAVMSRWKELPQLFAIVTRGGVPSEVFMEKAIEAVKAGSSPHKFARELSLRPRSLGVSEEK